MAKVQVEIEGMSPNTLIDEGERRIVVRTQLINNLVRGGFAKIVRFIPQEQAQQAPPGVNDRKAVWQDFLSSRGIKFQEDATKAQLQELWELNKQ